MPLDRVGVTVLQRRSKRIAHQHLCDTFRERTQAGLAAARARGQIGGRRPALGPAQQADMVAMVTAGRKTQAEAARLFQVHPATVSRLLGTHRQQTHPPGPTPGDA
jgi:DNA invertase Pin-like site-specific DNA recombinase